jgi:hypothetical protein
MENLNECSQNTLKVSSIIVNTYINPIDRVSRATYRSFCSDTAANGTFVVLAV